MAITIARGMSICKDMNNIAMDGTMATSDNSRKNAIDCYHAMFAEYERLEQINRKAEQWMQSAKARAQYRRIAGRQSAIRRA